MSLTFSPNFSPIDTSIAPYHLEDQVIDDLKNGFNEAQKKISQCVTKKIRFSTPVSDRNCFASEQDNADENIRVLERGIRAKHLNHYCIKSTLGSTGCTFLCAIPKEPEKGSHFLEKGNESSFVNFVLKLLRSDQAKIERFCSIFLKKYGFITPDIKFIDEHTKKLIFTHLLKVAPSIGSMEDELQMIYMIEFMGSNLSSIIKLKQFNDYEEKEKEEFFRFCGKLTLFDLLIGNDDRLLKFSPNVSEGDFVPRTGYSMNSGNLMYCHNTRTFYVIDNSSVCKSLSVNLGGSSSEELSDGFLNLFDEMSSESDSASVHESSAEEELRIRKEKEQDRERKIEGCQKIFSFFVKNPTRLASAIIEGFQAEFKESLNYDIDLSKYESFVYEGFLEGVALLKNKGIEGFSVEDYNRSVIKLIEGNFRSLEEDE